MYKPCEFHASTKDYLTAFYKILNQMIHGMEQACLTDSISHNFIVQMIPHHKAAIRMSENLLPIHDVALAAKKDHFVFLQNGLSSL